MSQQEATTLAVVAMAALALPWAVCAHPRDASTIEAARPGATYDYVVHVRNSYDYRYNPQVREDRIRLARQTIKPLCSKSEIVGEDKFETEIPGLLTGAPDYVVYVKCRQVRKAEQR